jgi:hypothetical protein
MTAPQCVSRFRRSAVTHRRCFPHSAEKPRPRREPIARQRSTLCAKFAHPLRSLDEWFDPCRVQRGGYSVTKYTSHDLRLRILSAANVRRRMLFRSRSIFWVTFLGFDRSKKPQQYWCSRVEPICQDSLGHSPPPAQYRTQAYPLERP